MTSTLAPQTELPTRTTKASWVWPVLRISLALIFLWSFLDKTFALGWSTGRDAETGAVDVLGEAAWVNGASPTTGFLSFGAAGPLAPVFNALAGNLLVDWLFMLGMLGVGVALMLGIGTLISTAAGVVIMVLLKLATWTSESNPIMDDHVIYIFLLIGLAVLPDARRFSLSTVWRNSPLVQQVPILR